MPELPEVETTRRGLERTMVDRTIDRAYFRAPGLRWPFPDQMAERLAGGRVQQIGRRGKYLLISLSSDSTLIAHLGMSGRFTVRTGIGPGQDSSIGDVLDKHDHVVFRLSDGVAIVYNDPRRFGMMDIAPTAELGRHRSLSGLGPDPLGNDFNSVTLEQRLSGRTASIKSTLMDQRTVAGLGNIYVSEALWSARISPQRASGDVAGIGCGSLVGSIRRVLQDAIDAGGSTLKDHRQVEGELGYFQHQFKVYGREDQPCVRKGCAGTVSRLVQSGRSTFCCESCQS